MHRGRGGTRQALPEHCYRVCRSPKTVTVSIPCNIMERLFSEGANLPINLRASPNSTPVHLPRSFSRATSSWSTVEPEGPHCYKEVVESRIESRQVDPVMPPLEDMPIDEQSEPNSFTSRGNTLRGRGLLCGAKCMHFSQRERTFQDG